MVSYYANGGKSHAASFATYSLEETATSPEVPDAHTAKQQESSPPTSSSSVSYYGSLAGRGLKKASVVLSAADAAMREGRTGMENLQRRQVLGSIDMARSMDELQAVIDARLPEMDPFACTVALHRLARCSHDVDKHAQNSQMARPASVSSSRTSLSQRDQRLWRASLSASVKQHPSYRVLLARLGNSEAMKQAQPRQLANMSWALARLRALEGLPLLREAAARCAARAGPGEWDSMSISLIPWSLATMGVPEIHTAAEILDMVRSINAAIRDQGSASWPPGDLSRVLWSWAKLAQKDDTFFRRASCLIMSRMPEYTPSQLAQTIWAFATVAPQDACGHFFPKAADAMLYGAEKPAAPTHGSGLTAYTPQHLAMAVWSFAAVLYRPEDLLEQIGHIVPDKLEKLNPQDISTTSWAFTTLLAKDRSIYEVLAATSIRTISEFNNQDLSNTVWAFASAGEYNSGFMDAVAGETCQRGDDFHGQHLAMVAWAFVTLRHRHDPLLRMIGRIANGRWGLGSWSNAKLLAFSFAGLPRLGDDALLGSEAWTSGAVRRLLDMFYERVQACSGDVDADDAWVVHDALLPWLCLPGSSALRASEAWEALNQLLAKQRMRLQGILESSEEFAAILVSEQRPETSIIRRYQECLQTFRIRGLGSWHTWQLLGALGALCAPGEEVSAAKAETAAQSASRSQTRVDGRGERQNWCFFRAFVHLPGHEDLSASEQGRLLNSTVVKYREDCGGFIHVKLHHDRVDHRAWDAEFRAMARTAAAARMLLQVPALSVQTAKSQAEELLRTGARREEETPKVITREAEASVHGQLLLFMTEVPCLSCIGAMAQFRRRFPNIALRIHWDGFPEKL